MKRGGPGRGAPGAHRTNEVSKSRRADTAGRREGGWTTAVDAAEPVRADTTGAADEPVVPAFGTTAGGDDNLQGGKGVDLVFGDDVLDVFDPTHAGGQDVMAGDDDIDALFGTGGDDTIHGNDDIDLAMGNGGNDLVYGDTGRNVTMPWSTVIHIGNLLLGNLGDDQVYGDKGVDVIFGNDGQDSL